MKIPRHDCDVPADQTSPWVCPTCGQHWHLEKGMVRGEAYRGMTRSHTVMGNENLAEAWALERIAHAIPWTQPREKMRARREARKLRRLEGQR